MNFQQKLVIFQCFTFIVAGSTSKDVRKNLFSAESGVSPKKMEKCSSSKESKKINGVFLLLLVLPEKISNSNLSILFFSLQRMMQVMLSCLLKLIQYLEMNLIHQIQIWMISQVCLITNFLQLHFDFSRSMH